ncbi:MAG: hypothetical protein WA162_05210 [Thermodesulfobacteriota bacterium]
MKTLKYMAIATMMIMMSGLLAGNAFAGLARATMTVSVRVLAVATQRVMYQTPVVNVTREDLARGYVEVAKATVMEVKTNSRSGYLLSFESSGGPFGEVWVVEGGRVTVITGSGGFVNEANRSGGVITEMKELGYRLYLADGAKTGSYAWPLSVQVIAN